MGGFPNTPLPKETALQRKKRYLLDCDPKVAKEADSHETYARVAHLLALTPLFKHFIGHKNDKRIQKLLKSVPSGERRTRKTEKEEDEELIKSDDYEPDSTVLVESPSYINGKLRDYQVQGLNWLISLHENKLSGILADEMGLGKTLQTISFLGYLRYAKGIDGPFIVIVPKSTLDNWRREFAKWTPEVNCVVLQGDKTERADILNNVIMEAKFDVLVTSFEMVIREKSSLKKIAWQYIVVDEAHRIKNEESALSQIIRLFYSKNRLLITGTPLQNNLHELWALLNFLLPDVFGDSVAFDEWFENNEMDQDLVVQQLHKVLSPFLLRRIKADVEKSLLPKIETNVYVGMSDMQVKWYKQLLEKDIDAVNGAVGKREGKTRLLNIVMQLRKCCNHPYLFEGAEPGPPYTTDEHLVYNCGKMVVLDKLLKRKKEQGSRVLIFSQMSRVLDIMEDYCFLRGYEYSRIDGSTAHEDRINAIDEYNAPDSEKFIFLLTTRAGGLGINLVTADTVVLYDSDWNPQADLQAMDRAHRIGQKKQVHVYRFVTEHAVEEKVIERAAQKLRLDQLVIQQGRSSKMNTSIGNNKDDLLNMIQFGAQEVFEKKSGDNLDDDIDAILSKGEEKTRQLQVKYQSLGLDDLQNFNETSAYEWNGENFTNKKQQAPTLWINPSKRERKEQTYSVDSYYKDMMSVGKTTPTPKLPRAPKSYNLYDHQFYNPQLKELLEKEQLYYKKLIDFKVADDYSPGNENVTKDLIKKEQQKIDNAEPMTEEEEKLKQQYLEEAFIDWSRRDFTNFIHLCAKFGREDLNGITGEIGTKTLEEVTEYSKAFWENYEQIEGYDKYVSTIVTAEKKAAKLQLQARFLEEKIKQCDSPIHDMTFQYPPNNSKRVYTVLEDRFLLMAVHKYGLFSENLYENVKADIISSDLFTFDWYFKSRTPLELSRRVNTLLLMISREMEGPDAFKRKRTKPVRADTPDEKRQKV